MVVMSTASTVTGNTSKAIERHLSSSYQVVLYVAKNLDKIDSAINLMDYFAAFYLGAHTTPPIDTPSGKPLTAGVFYLNVNNNTLYFWTQVNGVFQWTDLNDVVVNVIAEVDAHAATVTTTFTELAEGYDTTFLTYLNDTHTYRNETNLMYQEILLMHAAMLQAYEYVLPLLSHIAEIQAVSEHITEVVQVGANINAVITVSKDIAAILAVPLYMAEIRQAVTTTTTNAQKTTTDAAAALVSKNAATLSETNANAHKVASKASEDAAKLSELAAYASGLSSAASAQDAEASKTVAATAEVNSIANATASYNYSELARGYANDAEVSKGESQASAEKAEVHAQVSIVNADAAKVSELATKASEVASKASEVASKTSETNSKASELAAKSSETIATDKAAQTTADATLTASHVNQTASNVVLAVAAKDAAEAAASTVTGGIVDKGAWDASTGVFPDKPTRPLPKGGTALVSAFWKVTVAGTAEGVSFLIGDDLRFSASTDAFYKIDNTDAVASVQGKTGAVVLAANEIGALATPTGTHTVNTVLVAGATAGTSKHSGFTLAKSVPSNAVFTDTIYAHPTTDGNLHVPATGTTNNGKVLTAGSTEGSATWKTLATTDVNGLDAALLLKLDATANAVSATKLQNAVFINNVAFDGSANITITAANPTTITRGTGLTGADYNGASATTWAVAYGTAAGTACQGNDARLNDARTPLAHGHVWADVTGTPTTLAGYGITDAPTNTGSGASGSWRINITGNAATAYVLRTARTLTIGSTGKLFNGSDDVTWSLAEIGAAEASHTHPVSQIAGLGTAATRSVGTAAGNVMEVGAFGLGVGKTLVNGDRGAFVHTHNSVPSDFTGAISTYSSGILSAYSGDGYGFLLSKQHGVGDDTIKVSVRESGAWRPAVTLYHTGNMPETATRWPTLAEIGAQPAGSYAAASHTHSYLPLTGGHVTGALSAAGSIRSYSQVRGFGAGNTYVSAGLETGATGSDPSISFHKEGAYACTLRLTGNAQFGLFNQTNSGHASLNLHHLHAAGNVSAESLGVNQVDGVRGTGLSLYNGGSGGKPSFGMFFGATSKWGTHGTVSGDWATYLTMEGANNRGWIFQHGGANVASISANGVMSAYALTTNPNIGACSFSSGNGDSASFEANNIKIETWYGFGIWCTAGTPAYSHYFNARTGDFSAKGSITASGNVLGYSDKRVKSYIEVIPDALAKVKKLRGVTFNRTDMNNMRQTGVIAQEVEAVLPEAVCTSENGDIKDFKSVAYGNLVGLLIEAIKEQQQQMDNLKEIINGITK